MKRWLDIVHAIESITNKQDYQDAAELHMHTESDPLNKDKGCSSEFIQQCNVAAADDLQAVFCQSLMMSVTCC